MRYIAEANLAYTAGVHDCSFKFIILGHGVTDIVPYDYWKGRPNVYEPHASPRSANKFQVEKNWGRKNDGSPPPAHMN